LTKKAIYQTCPPRPSPRGARPTAATPTGAISLDAMRHEGPATREEVATGIPVMTPRAPIIVVPRRPLGAAQAEHANMARRATTTCRRTDRGMILNSVL